MSTTTKRAASTPAGANEGSTSARNTKPMNADSDSTDPVDIREYPDKYVYIMDMPGLKENEIKVHVEESNVLVIYYGVGKVKEEKNDGGVKYLKMGRKIVNIDFKFRLPFDANPHAISAAIFNGVLSVTVKKFVHVEPKKPKIVKVELDFYGYFR